MTTGRGGKKRKRRRKTDRRTLYIRGGILVLVLLTVILGIYSCASGSRRNLDVDASEPDIDVQLVIHYTANPGSTAQENRDYFNGLQYSQETEASSNFVVGMDGEIIQCVPTWEVAYASNERNFDTVSIECCHPDDSGEFTDETYRSLVQLTAWLCLKFDLSEDDVIRHYDVTGKVCPKYFVDHEDAWEEFRQNVRRAMDRTLEN